MGAADVSTVLDIPTPEAHHLDELLRREGSSLRGRERHAELALGGLFAAVVAALLLVVGVQGDGAWPQAAAAMAVMACAMHVRFDAAGGFTVPTQLGFVPLLFVCPPALLPLATLAAVVAGRLPAALTGGMPLSRLALCVPNCMFALGPAVLLAIVGPEALREHPLGVLAGCLATQVAVDAAASFARDVYELGMSLRELVRPAAPVYLVDVVLTPTGYLVALAGDEHAIAPLAVLPLLAVLGAFSRERRARIESMQELNAAYRGTAAVLGDVVEHDDTYTGEHSKAVVDLSLATGRRLGLTAGRLRDLEFGALLHDVGKVAIPKTIINKPGRLDADEWELVKQHTVLGQRMLDQVGGFMRGVGTIVRSHHERWDGAGYPDALVGPAIPLEARIICCCDAYNAMTTDRPYRPALATEAARAELRACRGTQFDPDVVDAVLAVVGS
jgi:HD-GYP domain-containing protein (c-di-GMP phosphodiesterase class II)